MGPEHNEPNTQLKLPADSRIATVRGSFYRQKWATRANDEFILTSLELLDD